MGFSFPSSPIPLSLIFTLLLRMSLFPDPCLGEIKDLVFKAETRPIILFEKFGFTLRGHANISIDLEPSDRPVDPTALGFLLATDDALVQVVLEYEHSEVCILRNPIIRLLFTFDEIDPKSNKLSRLFPINDANEYGLYFANCGRRKNTASFHVRTELYNLEDGASNTKDYLPAGQTKLPLVFLSFFFLYLGLVFIWAWVCFKNKGLVHTIHLLMGVLLCVKAMDLLSEAEDKLHIKSTGSPHGWDVAFYVFSFLKGIMLFIVIVLIGTGWTILKPFLQDKEKKILMIVIPLQVLSNIASVVIDETGPFAKDWVTWKQLLLVLDLTCCCAVLFPIMWSIRDLKKASHSDGKAARTLAKLTLFRQYYIVLFMYIYFTRVVVFALTTVTSYKYRWVSDCAAEVVSLAFYLFTGFKFSPGDKNPYLAIEDDEEEEAAKEALNMDDFEL